jgi:hypothetical protein
VSDDERTDTGEEPRPDEEPQPDEPQGDETPPPPLAAMGIVAGTVIGGGAGLILGHLAIGAGIGCAAGLVIGAAAQALRSRRQEPPPHG